jgi:hypothetical protein
MQEVLTEQMQKKSKLIDIVSKGRVYQKSPSAYHKLLK